MRRVEVLLQETDFVGGEGPLPGVGANGDGPRRVRQGDEVPGRES